MDIYDSFLTQLEGDTVKANKIRDQLRNKLEKVDRYRQEVRDFNDTRARDVEPKKYNKFEAKRRSKRTDVSARSL